MFLCFSSSNLGYLETYEKERFGATVGFRLFCVFCYFQCELFKLGIAGLLLFSFGVLGLVASDCLCALASVDLIFFDEFENLGLMYSGNLRLALIVGQFREIGYWELVMNIF